MTVPGFNNAGPANRSWHAKSALPLRGLLVAKHGGTTVGPGEKLRAVVRRIHNDGVVGNAPARPAWRAVRLPCRRARPYRRRRNAKTGFAL